MTVSWPVAAVIVGVGWCVYLLSRIADATARLNEHLGNIRFRLGQIDDRQTGMSERLQGIEAHTHRAVREKLEDDRWRDRQPPV